MTGPSGLSEVHSLGESAQGEWTLCVPARRNECDSEVVREPVEIVL